MFRTSPSSTPRSTRPWLRRRTPTPSTRTLAERYRVRRYGFHGTSHKYVSGEAARFLGRPLGELKQIVLHLGNGASACAVDGGRSVDTSMGMTPLEGLVMGTRSGDIDPAVLLHLSRRAHLDTDDLDELLNRRSGLLGLSGHRDMRDVRAAAEAGDDSRPGRARHLPPPAEALHRRLSRGARAASTCSSSPPGWARTTRPCGPARSPASKVLGIGDRPRAQRGVLAGDAGDLGRRLRR